ncbi:MAG TPA: RsmE family RNA methyltransferase [Fimbriimonadaceae bacterium]|jgi:16S rRNA (uracil1498-N3)-methyltransferase
MDRGNIPPLRSLPRIFVPGADPEGAIDLPKEEVEKLRKVLRLAEGDAIAVLPDNGSLIRCEFNARQAWPVGVEWPQTEPTIKVTLAQALPKGDKIDTVIHMCTEIGVSRFIFFESDRSVVKWDEGKRNERIRRLNAIGREAAEQSFRTRIPTMGFEKNLEAVLKLHPEAIVLSEVEGLDGKLHKEPELKVIGPDSPEPGETVLVVGPEGGWSPRELILIGDRGVSLGPRVLRTDTAGPAAAALLLLG